ncbi:glycosyltransferase family 39 protein [Blautia obeum]
MINATANDVHPPLHYFLIQLMYHIFGNKGFAYHLSGFIPYVFLLIIICSYIRKRFGMLTAFFMVTMCSLMKEAVRYNVEARMYSMGALFVLLAFLALYEIIKKKLSAGLDDICNSIISCGLYTLLCLGCSGFFLSCINSSYI